MKLRHAAALALVGWYLMMPLPLRADGPIAVPGTADVETPPGGPGEDMSIPAIQGVPWTPLPNEEQLGAAKVTEYRHQHPGFELRLRGAAEKLGLHGSNVCDGEVSHEPAIYLSVSDDITPKQASVAARKIERDAKSPYRVVVVCAQHIHSLVYLGGPGTKNGRTISDLQAEEKHQAACKTNFAPTCP